MQDTITDIEHICLITRDEFAIRLGVTATGAQDQVAVGGRGQGYRVLWGLLRPFGLAMTEAYEQIAFIKQGN